jgi:hypothetical protein
LVRVIKRILYLLFGEWNGVQNFAAPAVFAFLFDKTSFIQWIAVLLSYQRYYLPIFLYSIFLLYMLMLIIKAIVQWDNCTCEQKIHRKVRMWRDFLVPLIIRFHKWLLAFITLLMFIYILKAIYIFFYRTSLPLMTIYINLARIAFISGIIYVYLLCDVTIPLLKKGHNFERSQVFFHKYLVREWKSVLIFYCGQLVLILLSIWIFLKVTDFLALTGGLGIVYGGKQAVVLKFLEVRNLGDLMGNTLLLPFAYVFSNVLYSPLMLALKWAFDHYKKRNRDTLVYAEKKKNTA